MKADRQARILALITEHPIETQEELADRLVAEGFKVTQYCRMVLLPRRPREIFWLSRR